MIPLMVDFTDKQVTICGGGQVGARKAAYVAGEASVTIYSRSFSPACHDLPVRLVQTEISSEPAGIDRLISGSFLVIAATSDPPLNAAIAERCRKAGILCNNVTSTTGDITLPAKFTGERFTIAVSTRGGSPAVARYVREHLQNTMPHLDTMIILEEELRSDLKQQNIPEEQRREILTRVLHDPIVWENLSGGLQAARAYVQEKHLI